LSFNKSQKIMEAFDIISAIFSPIIVAILSLILGLWIIKLTRIAIPPIFMCFAGLSIGNLIINIITSIWITNGITVQLLFIPLLFIGILISPKRTTYEPFEFKKNILIILSYSTIWVIFYIISLWELIINTEIIQTLYRDVYYYVMVSESIFSSGNENSLNGINSSEYLKSGTSPYHYYELYQTLIFSKLFNFNSLWSFIFSVPVFMGVQASLLINAIISSIAPYLNKKIIFSLGFLLLFILGFNLVPIDYTEKNNFTLNIINHVSPKYFVVYMLMILMTYLTYHKYFSLLFVFMAIIPIISFLYLPVILGTGILGSFVLYFTKSMSLKKISVYISLIFITCLGILSFYHFTAIPKDFQRFGLNYHEIIISFLNNPFHVIKRIIGAHAYYPFDYLQYILAILILFFSLKRNKEFFKKNLGVFIFFIILFEVAVVITWLLFDFHIEGWQFQYFVVGIGSNVIICWLFIQLVDQSIKYSWIYLSVVLLFISFRIYEASTDHYVIKKTMTSSFTQKVKEIFDTQKVEKIAFIEKDPRYPTIEPIGNFLLNIDSEIQFECISQSIINSDNPIYNKCTFYQYAKKESIVKESFELQIEFLKKYKIEYLLIEKTDSTSQLYKATNEIAFDSINDLSLRKVALERLGNK